MTTCTFKDVWLVPKLERSLLWVAQLEGAGANIQFVGGRCEIRTSKGALALSCNRQEGLYALGQPLDAAAQCNTVAVSTTAVTLETWHRRLGHFNRQSVQLIARKGLVQGMEAVGVLETAPCSTCALGEATKLPFPKEYSSRASEVLELVHSNVCGAMWLEEIAILSSSLTTRAPLSAQDQSRDTFQLQDLAAAAATETGRPLKQRSSVATPQQKGVAECMNGTLLEMAQCLLLQAGLPYKFWGHTLAEATGLLAEAVAPGEDTPASLKAALKVPDARQWEQAAQTELNSLHANHTWDLVPLPAGCQPIKYKWVFKIKRAADGSLQRYKAHLVAKGFSQ
ncbi:DNA-directed DNA polymerase [Powellomyces hirtus]|uniref:DNA-directed DNA polymerase n=1 Tax=Powellomyces hirtus TaxID=109895 RepID=A0A507DW77_9FUNG|nr:DNA-directed DNA polymerase [Powellomyces hirtus]